MYVFGPQRTRRYNVAVTNIAMIMSTVLIARISFFVSSAILQSTKKLLILATMVMIRA